MADSSDGTDAINFPFKNGPSFTPSGENQAFFAVIDPSQAGEDSLIYASTWLGGSFARGTAIAVDNSGKAYVVGTTISSGLVTTPDGLVQSNNGGHDGFLTVVDLNRMQYSSLVSSTYFGSKGQDWIQGIDRKRYKWHDTF